MVKLYAVEELERAFPYPKAALAPLSLVPQGDDWHDVLDGVPEGGRNTAAARLVGVMARHQLPIELTLDYLNSWNLRNRPPLHATELERTVCGMYGRYAAGGTIAPAAPAVAHQLDEFLAIEFPKQESFVGDGLIARGEKTMIAGEPKAGKTFFAIQCGLSVAAGEPFLGMDVPASRRVLYVQAELGNGALQGRVAQMRRRYATDLPFYLCTDFGMVLTSAAGQESLRAVMRAVAPDLLILDPLYKFSRKDLSSQPEMQGVLDFLDNLIIDFNCALLLVHHHRKSNSDRPAREAAFGSSVLLWWPSASMNLVVHDDETEVRRLSFPFLRHHAAMTPLKLTLDDETLLFAAEPWDGGGGLPARQRPARDKIIELLRADGGGMDMKDLNERLHAGVRSPRLTGATLSWMEKHGEIERVKKDGAKHNEKVVRLLLDDPVADDDDRGLAEYLEPDSASQRFSDPLVSGGTEDRERAR